MGIAVAPSARTLLATFEHLPKSPDPTAACGRVLRQKVPWHFQDRGESQGIQVPNTWPDAQVGLKHDHIMEGLMPAQDAGVRVMGGCAYPCRWQSCSIRYGSRWKCI